MYEDITQGLIASEEDEELQLLALLEACRIKADSTYDEPDYTLKQNGTGFAPKGNIMALMAEMKHGKTFVNTTLAAAILKGSYMGLVVGVFQGSDGFLEE